MKSEVNSALDKNDETVTLFTKLLNKSFNADLFFLLSRINPNGISEQLVNLAEAKANQLDKDNFKSLIQKTNFDASIFYGLGNYFQKKDKTKSKNVMLKPMIKFLVLRVIILIISRKYKFNYRKLFKIF